MRKVKLEIESLEVDSFVTGYSGRLGTVRGHIEEDGITMVGGTCYTFGCVEPNKCATVGADVSCLNTLKTCGEVYTCNGATICVSGSYCNPFSYNAQCTGNVCTGEVNCTGVHTCKAGTSPY